MSIALNTPSTNPLNLTRGNDRVRVTGSETRSKHTLIKGVPVRETGVVKSASYSVRVWVKSEHLPVEPAPGQVWSVEGDYDLLSVDVGDFTTQARRYSFPESLGFNLPNDGETFVQFIARDPEFKGVSG